MCVSTAADMVRTNLMNEYTVILLRIPRMLVPWRWDSVIARLFELLIKRLKIKIVRAPVSQYVFVDYYVDHVPYSYCFDAFVFFLCVKSIRLLSVYQLLIYIMWLIEKPEYIPVISVRGRRTCGYTTNTDVLKQK